MRVHHLREGNRLEAAVLDRDQRRVAALDDVPRGAVAEVARVLHVEGDRVGAAQLVADVLGDDRGLDVELGEALRHRGLQDVAEVDLGDADVTVRVALDAGELRRDRPRAEHLDEPFGEHRDAVGAAVGEALDDRADERVDDRLERACPAGNSSGMSVSVAPAALPMPSARCPAFRPMATTKYQREVVFASTIRFLTISTPMCRAVWKPKV